MKKRFTLTLIAALMAVVSFAQVKVTPQLQLKGGKALPTMTQRALRRAFPRKAPAAVVVPETAEIVDGYKLSGYVYASSDGWQRIGWNAPVAFDGNDVYLSETSLWVSDCWIKGTFISDTEIRVPSFQFYGVDDGDDMYFAGVDVSGDAPVYVDAVIFDYDPATGTISLPEGTFICETSDPSVDTTPTQLWAYGQLFTYSLGGGDESSTLWVAAEQGYTNTQEVTEIDLGAGFTGVFAQGIGSNAPKYYDNGEAVRMYKNNTLTITAPDEETPIQKIVFTMASSTYTELEASEGVYTRDAEVGTWEGPATEVTFTVPTTQARIVSIEVFYAGEGGEDQLIQIPEDLEYSEYNFSAVVNAETGLTEDRPVFVGFYEYEEVNYVFIYGLSNGAKAWSMGTLADDGTITIPQGEYQGQFYTSSYGYLPVYTDEIVLQYDDAAGRLTSEEYYTLTVIDGTASIYEAYSNVVIEMVVETAAMPAQPEVTSVTFDTDYPYLNAYVPVRSVDGSPLLTSKLFYELYYDIEGEKTLYTFTATDYQYINKLFGEDIQQVPFLFDDNWDIYEGGSTIFVYGNFADWNKVGIRSIYFGGDEVNPTEIEWYTIKDYTGIVSAEAAKEGTAQFFDLQGRQVPASAKGMLIKQVRQADGTTTAVKVLRK